MTTPRRLIWRLFTVLRMVENLFIEAVGEDSE